MITDPKWGIRPFPIDKFREGQEEVIDAIAERFHSGVSVVLLQAPPGTGKSVIGEGVRRLVKGTGIYCCSSKALQDQFAAAFPYGKVVKGRANYLTLSGPLDRMGRKTTPAKSVVSCADCTWNKEDGCRWCVSRTGCPYQVARNAAMQSELAVLNTSYLLADANRGRGRFTGRDLTIIDEADLVEAELLGQVEVYISKRRLYKLEMDVPSRKTVESSWHPWVVKEAIPKLDRYLEMLPSPNDRYATQENIKEYNSLMELRDRLVILRKELPNGGWVYDGYQDDDVIFRSVEVNQWGGKYLWRYGKRFLLMSATILSGHQMIETLGFNGQWDIIDVPSSFPVENRPVYVVPIADVTNKLKEKEWPKLAEGVAGVLRLHPNDRILVHTVSYSLAQYLKLYLKTESSEFSRRPIIIYDNSKEKQAALNQYKTTKGAVILAPSLDRGIDLPGDLCRVQVIAKIPFMNTSDKRINARMRNTPGGYTWYKMEAIRTLIQMCGRGVRSDTDTCDTYILDKQFTSNIMKSQHLLPKWWKDSLVWNFNPRRLLESRQ